MSEPTPDTAASDAVVTPQPAAPDPSWQSPPRIAPPPYDSDPGPWYRAELASRTERLLLALLAIAGAIVLTIAVALPPAGAGHGTHQQLGLPPCSFLTLTGVPCLSCGMTTSFAHTVRGELPSAVAAQPFGTFLAILTIICVPVFFAGAISGRSVAGPAGRLPWNKLGPALLVFLLAAWGYKVAAMRGWFG